MYSIKIQISAVINKLIWKQVKLYYSILIKREQGAKLKEKI